MINSVIGKSVILIETDNVNQVSTKSRISTTMNNAIYMSVAYAVAYRKELN